MKIEGTLKELSSIFYYAVRTDCTLMYFSVNGDIYLLYGGGHYVYFKCLFYTSHNIALPRQSYYNIHQFILAELQRAKKQQREIELIRIEEHIITVSSTLKISHQIDNQFFKDTLFSPVANQLEALKMSTPPENAPMMRVQKKVIKSHYRQMNAYRHTKSSFTKLNIHQDQLHIARIFPEHPERNRSSQHKEGFHVIRDAARQTFILYEDAIKLLLMIPIPEYAYVYLTKDETYSQVEYDVMPGKFRFFMPHTNVLENLKPVISKVNE